MLVHISQVEAIDIMTFPIYGKYWKVIKLYKIHVPNHQYPSFEHLSNSMHFTSFSSMRFSPPFFGSAQAAGFRQVVGEAHSIVTTEEEGIFGHVQGLLRIKLCHQRIFQKPKLEVHIIYKAYFSGLNFREYPQKIWPEIWYVYVALPKSRSSHVMMTYQMSNPGGIWKIPRDSPRTLGSDWIKIATGWSSLSVHPKRPWARASCFG